MGSPPAVTDVGAGAVGGFLVSFHTHSVRGMTVFREKVFTAVDSTLDISIQVLKCDILPARTQARSQLTWSLSYASFLSPFL